ncbi:MAG: 2-keto-3-deoxy-L-rhamnonate aldolase RhmA [Candidatus Poriferisodalaceae bacterium]|jgi:2-keto-3-deoxy-L-rhamnonate aldolase RhmA
MRPNPVKRLLADGGTAYGTMVFEFLSAGLPQILSNSGADFVFYDMEHSGFSMSEMKTQFALCRGMGLTPLVRPRDTTYANTAQLLDLGAMGMLFQMCETAEQAEAFVSWTRYPPQGRRGAMFGGAHDDYLGADGTLSVPQIIDGAHDRTMVCVLIESAKGLANADEIMAVPGVDVAHLGHGDLSLSLEVPGNTAHPTMQAGIDTILAACENNGKAAACLAGNVETGVDWVNRGFRMVSYSFDIGLLGSALAAGINQIRAEAGGEMGES